MCLSVDGTYSDVFHELAGEKNSLSLFCCELLRLFSQVFFSPVRETE